MKTYKSIPKRLKTPCLPEEIYVSFKYFETDLPNVDPDLVQNQSGMDLIHKMADLFLNEDEIQILTKKYEKPQAFCGEREVSVSFSHTDDGVAGTMSFCYNVGCDMESTGRNVHPRLVERMKNRGEADKLYLHNDPLRIWTLKEAALKMIGTGLRKPMNSVQLTMLNTNEFDVMFDNGNRAKICSFQYKDHWLSICYQEGFANS